jgi:hypothetical protein
MAAVANRRYSQAMGFRGMAKSKGRTELMGRPGKREMRSQAGARPLRIRKIPAAIQSAISRRRLAATRFGVVLPGVISCSAWR